MRLNKVRLDILRSRLSTEGTIVGGQFEGRARLGRDISRSVHFPVGTFPGRDISRLVHFPVETFPGWYISRAGHFPVGTFDGDREFFSPNKPAKNDGRR